MNISIDTLTLKPGQASAFIVNEAAGMITAEATPAEAVSLAITSTPIEGQYSVTVTALETVSSDTDVKIIINDGTSTATINLAVKLQFLSGMSVFEREEQIATLISDLENFIEELRKVVVGNLVVSVTGLATSVGALGTSIADLKSKSYMKNAVTFGR